ncbi:MAG: phosphotransferase family protein [Alphaproteobacteria bacterium]
MKPEVIAEKLGPFLERETGARVRIDGLRSMTGGATREAFRLDVTVERPGEAPATHPLVLLVFRPGGQRAFGARDEYRLIEALGRVGAPVPRPFAAGEEELGRPFYLMERVPGEAIGRRIVREDRFARARQVLPGQLARALAAIHRVPLDDGSRDFLPGPSPGVPMAASEVDRLEQLYRVIAVEPHPVFEITLRWLRSNLPASRPDAAPALVHGDFRIGNVLVDEDGLRAVLDWELAHRGDPLEDLGWICVRSWRFGNDRLTLGGIADREALFSAYEEAVGHGVDRAALRFWEIYGNLRWGVFTLVQVRGFLDGVVSSIELASIGRRTAETEWELLRLIEGRAD